MSTAARFHAPLIVVTWIILASTVMAQRAGGPAPPSRRDGQAVPETGTSVISGIVVSDEAGTHPVRRAAVSTRNSDSGAAFMLMTDDAGRFEFRDLPAGRFVVSVTKPGYVATTYGASRPQTPGLTIALLDGERVSDLRIRLPRGAVITGRVVDEQGQPASGLRIVASERVIVNGEPSYRGFGSIAQTDDRGMYRIYGLAAGSYIVHASVNPGFALGGGAPRLTTSAEVQWAQSAAPTRPGGQATVLPPPPPRGQGHRYTTVYYPGTTDHASASTVTVGVGEERSAVDFVVQLVPTATVEGVVLGMDGQPTGTNVQIMALSATTTPMMGLIELPPRASVGPDGRFSVSGLAPGQYMVTARAPSAGAKPVAGGRAGTSPPVMDLWAVADLNVIGVDVSGVVLRLAPGMRVSGRIAFEAATETPPSDLSRAQIRLVTPPANAMSFGVPPGQANADGTFSFVGAPPGQYYFTANLIGGTPARPSWTVKSAAVNGRDVLDTPFEVRPGEDIANLLVTFTDRLTTLSGSLTDQAGRPAPGYFVMAFPVNTTYWRQQSRWLRPPTRPASDGRFSIVGLPPGDYHLAAITEFSPQEWYTPAFLQQLVPLSLKFTLREGEEHRQDIRLAGN
jgi:hypothetical protein